MGIAWAASGAPQKGELGGDLALLKSCYQAPEHSGQSNHYIDLWDGGRIRALATQAGLTNNRALLINSHGKGHRSSRGRVYAFYPHLALAGSRYETQLYSIKDLADLLGPRAAEIHNVIIAGCDLERTFTASGILQHFPNATNITHTASGEAGYQPMFVQAVLSPSEHIEPLYETASLTPQGAPQYQLSVKPSPKAKKLSPYVAELFNPGAREPFRTQVAGRELLDPVPSKLTLANSVP